MKPRRTNGIHVAITGLHIPYDENAPITKVVVNERNVMNYYKFVQGGPAEAGHLNVDGVELAVYVNSRYGTFEPDMVNKRATILFAIAGVGMLGGAVRGDALAVGPAGNSDYEKSLDPAFSQFLLELEWAPLMEQVQLA
jgi:hypothetical protein